MAKANLTKGESAHVLRTFIIQAAVFLMPIAIYALYRWGTKDLAKEGKAWPIQILDISGAVLSFGVFVAMAGFQPQVRGACYYPPAYIDGELREAYTTAPDDDGTCPGGATRTAPGEAPKSTVERRVTGDIVEDRTVAPPPPPPSAGSLRTIQPEAPPPIGDARAPGQLRDAANGQDDGEDAPGQTP